MIYWFTGASTQAVTTCRLPRGGVHQGEHPPGEQYEGVGRRQQEGGGDLHAVRAEGMFNIFLGVFFGTLAFAFAEPFFFIGYLVSIALFGLYQAIFMANAGGAWDNAKKIVETELKMKGSPLHDATVVGDTVGDPFKDTSSVAMNPVIKFTTLFGLLAVELAVSLSEQQGSGFTQTLALIFFAVSATFVWRSFYAMRIQRDGARA
jgi:K(+)-stimulated pyrophosphate-energized sodium pump